MTPEDRVTALGLILPDFDRDGYYGTANGPMKPFHRSGNILFLSGHVAMIGDRISHKGRLGADLTTAEGYAAARQTGLNVLGGIRQAVGSLNKVTSMVRCLNFVVCTPEYDEVNRVATGMSDLLIEVFGQDIGLGGRATIGVTALAGGVCFETWVTLEVAD